MKSVSYHNSQLSLETAKALRKLRLAMPLLPNLRHLVVQHYGLRATPSCIADLLLGPKLESIEIASLLSTEVDLVFDLGFLQTINKYCPSLRRLSIDYPIMERSLGAIQDLITEQVELETLEIGFLTPKILAHIAIASKLRRLEIANLRARDLGSISGPGLAHITSLQLSTAEDVTTLDQFLSLCRPYQLQQLALAISFDRFVPSSKWQQFFQTLSCYCSSRLEVLRIWQNTHQEIELEAFLPLLTLRNLTTLSMTRVFPDLDNYQLARIAEAWPHLQVLHLRSPGAGMNAGGITPEGLLPLLENCPELRDLALTVNVPRHCIRISGRPWRGISNPNITTLNVGNSVIQDSIAIALLFYHIFPNLEKIISWGCLDHMQAAAGEVTQMLTYRSRWKEVLPIMKTMKDSHLRGERKRL
jgi:hypothetical protein